MSIHEGLNPTEASFPEITMRKILTTSKAAEKAYLVGIESSRQGTPLWAAVESLDELSQLARTAGLDVSGSTFQKREGPDPSYYIGSGKLAEIGEEMALLNTRTLIADDELSPGQLRSIEKQLPEGYKVIDRTSLILDIFAQHAFTREGQLQVELAQCQYRLPRLTRMWTHLVRQSGARAGGIKGGVGLRGPGETQIETDRRLMRKRISSLRKQLEDVRQNRRNRRKQRQDSGIPVVTLVGYTNSGKSSLFKALTREDILVEDRLFATLDPKTRRVALPSGREVLFTDTVGFINKLPPDLVAAFRATLEEVAESDLLLHLVDISSGRGEAQRTVVEQLLKSLGVESERVLTVWNKIDKLPEHEPSRNHTPMISARTGQGIERLLTGIETALKQNMDLIEVVIPYNKAQLLGAVHRRGTVEAEEHGERGTYLRAYVPALLASRLSRYRTSP